MIKVIRKSEAKERKITENKSAFNYITKDISPEVSLSVIEGVDFKGVISLSENRIYFILSGSLVLNLNGEKTTLYPEDSCLISKGTTYTMSGTFKAVSVDQPAYGTGKN